MNYQTVMKKKINRNMKQLNINVLNRRGVLR